ncbi:MalY/PatB family protein [Mobiluncus curtisii]|uniref:MalY/PatB family protein n=1 Tax=Mobiluncus curtisii TaxID=2051 RepID=UPI00242C5C86|nr:aminotransferase class I/II-fold pyridoxal phosphate-dependent enzyme [Mobiluncus curtisii]
MIALLSLTDLKNSRSLKWSAHPGALGMWVAEMDFGIAPGVRATLQSALDDTVTGYPPVGLSQQVGQALREFYADEFGWTIQPDAVGVAADVLSVLQAVVSILPPQAPVVVPTPAYMPFLTLPQDQGHEVIQVASLYDAATGKCQLNLEGISQAFATAESGGLLVLCNPWNPVGKCVNADEMSGLCTILEQNPHVLVFSDEIHSPLVLDGKLHPFANYSDLAASRTVTASAASKGWNIPGLHCAQWIIPDESLRKRLRTPLQVFASGATPWGMLATISAFRDCRNWLGEVKAQIVENRELVRNWLTNHGEHFRVFLPEATYLSWWETDGILGDCPARTLQERGLIVNDGADLGTGFEKAFRLNLATTPEVLHAALNLIGARG